MKRRALTPALLLAGSALLFAGCSSCEMKGTPFYTGDYQINVPGADERRVNLWPLAYYREPALSVAWPLFEHTEEHVAVRPLFSAYGDTNAFSEYNALWPLCQADTRSDDYRVFPYFWGENRRGDVRQRYHVLFPFFWHFENETCSLFPAWLYRRDRSGGPATDRDLWLLWPLLRWHTAPDESQWHATLFGRYRYQNGGEDYAGYPWPLLFSWQTPTRHGLFTPLYAYASSDKAGVRDGWDALPLLLSWHRRQGESQDLTAALGLFHQSRDGKNRSGWLFPLCAYDTRDRLFLTPVLGWDKPDDRDPDGFWYPLTPLAGARTGAHRGGWLFPLFSHKASVSNDTFSTRVLLLGYAGRSRHAWKEGTWQRDACGFFPLFSHSVNASTRHDTQNKTTVERLRHIDRQLLFRWSEEDRTTCRTSPPGSSPYENYVTRSADSGVFPLWRKESKVTTALDGSLLSQTDESSVLLALYDTRHNTAAATGDKPALDDLRRRILWRVWHYERRSGNVSADLFPFITYDAHTDGFSKTSFLWRLFRYERHPEGAVDLDLLFLPLRRAR